MASLVVNKANRSRNNNPETKLLICMAMDVVIYFQLASMMVDNTPRNRNTNSGLSVDSSFRMIMLMESAMMD